MQLRLELVTREQVEKPLKLKVLLEPMKRRVR